ncbi:MAG: TolC family protein [Planctomycetota bacterium]
MPRLFRTTAICCYMLISAVVSPCAVVAQQALTLSVQANPQASTNTSTVKLDWWSNRARETLLDEAPHWVSFDLDTVLLDTLRSSPRIQSVSRNASVSLEQIIQQDAAFDPNLVFETRLGRTNDPVGNALITGGPPRLIEESLTTRGGVQKTFRRGTQIDMSQELGLLDSNSNFFTPPNQGNTRLSLSLTQPLLERGGRVYNERLLTQARLDSRVSWQEMRGQVEQRIADVIDAYWRLYELRCHLLQQRELLRRGERLQSLLEGRQQLDTSRIELAKARQRVARRTDRLLQLKAELQIQQARFIGLVGSNQLTRTNETLELIPLEIPGFPNINLELRDALVRGLENRPEVRAATADLESAALAIRVTRTELRPQLTSFFEGYLAGLNGRSDITRSFGDQFSEGGPGVAGGVSYEMPYGRRAARSRYREAQYRYQQRSEELREAMQVTRAEIATAIVNAQTAMAQRETKYRLLATAWDEEVILTKRWEMMAGDGANVGTVLETLLDAQQRRTDAERELTSAATRYVSSLVDLQRAMGTLLINLEITPVRDSCGNQIHFLHSDSQSLDEVSVGGMIQSDQSHTPLMDADRDAKDQAAGRRENQSAEESTELPNDAQQRPILNAPAEPIPTPSVPSPELDSSDATPPEATSPLPIPSYARTRVASRYTSPSNSPQKQTDSTDRSQEAQIEMPNLRIPPPLGRVAPIRPTDESLRPQRLPSVHSSPTTNPNSTQPRTES